MPFWSIFRGNSGKKGKKGKKKKSNQGSKVHDESIQSQCLLDDELDNSSLNSERKSQNRSFNEDTPQTTDNTFDESQNVNCSIVSAINTSFDYASEDESVEGYKEKMKKYGPDSPLATATCLNNLGYYYQQNAMSVSSSPASSPLNNRKYCSPSRSSPMSVGSVASSALSIDSGSMISRNGDVDVKNATDAYKASLKIKKKEFGKNHPSVATTMNNLASVYFAQGCYEKALKYYEKSVKIMIKHLGNDHLNVATIFNNIGDVHYALQNDEIAINCYSESLRVRKITLINSDIRVKRLVDKIELIRWKRQVAESHDNHDTKKSPKRENEVSMLKRELSADLNQLTAMCDDLAGDMAFHVELMSRKRERRENQNLCIEMDIASPLKKFKSISDEFMDEL